VATKAQCESALRIYTETLLAFKNVVGVGTGPLADADAEFAVVIRVSRKIPIEELEEDDVLPSFLQVRDATGLYKVPTRVVEFERS
jgi:hypothetical protein